jgi:hypothetical protein
MIAFRALFSVIFESKTLRLPFEFMKATPPLIAKLF